MSSKIIISFYISLLYKENSSMIHMTYPSILNLLIHNFKFNNSLP